MQGNDYYGGKSPGGFVFGVQGWIWQPPRVTSITFFLDNTAKVSDQYGRPIHGTELNGKKVLFAQQPPSIDDAPGSRKGLATHAEVIAALWAERIDWRGVPYAGFPQLPYEELKKIANLKWPFDDEHILDSKSGCHCIYCCIKDPQMRRDALRVKREIDDAIEKEFIDDEEAVEKAIAQPQKQAQGGK